MSVEPRRESFGSGLRALRFGERAVLVECADAAEARAVAIVARRELPGIADVVPAARTVLLDGIEGPEGVDRVLAAVPGWRLPTGAASAGPLVRIPVRYDGPDLPAVAEHWGVDVATAIARHRDREYVVEFCGFAPGFGYCSGLGTDESVPRLTTPRSRVPAGAVAVAGTWTAVYPRASPGGWRILGHTDTVLWHPDREPPALLAPGTRVRFVDG